MGDLKINSNLLFLIVLSIISIWYNYYMELNKIIIGLLEKLYKEELLELDESKVLDFFSISKNELKKITSFTRFFYFHNEKIKLRNNLRIGTIQKRKLVDFLVTPQGDNRLVYKALAFDGDLVLMDLLNEKILIYLKRSITHLIATVKFSKRSKPYFILDSIEEYHLELTTDAPLIKGAIIYVEIDEIIGDKILGTYLKTIAHEDDPDAETLKIVYHKGWPIEFSDEALLEADEVSVDYEYELKNRRDLRNLLTFTIDGEDAKDLDDAISIELIDNNYQVGIHIADIGYLVKEGTKLDEEALLRGTSVYLVDRVIPMLPHAISNGVGSLNEGVDRLTLSCFVTFDENYKILDYEIVKSVINSKKRLTYKEVNQLFEKDKWKHHHEISDALLKLYEIAKFLEISRKQTGTIDFESTELKFITKNRRVVKIEKRQSGPAERMIEALMILANETVANHMHNLQYPSVYRIHEMPDLDRLMESVKTIEKLGFKVKTKDFRNPKTISELTDMALKTRYHKIVSMLVLKAMKRAKYTAYRDIHYGLNSQCYTHFTAPIRRYPDLILHRVIHDLLFKGANFEKRFNYYDANLPEILKDNSNQERLAIDIERDVEKLASIEFLNNNLDKTYKGQIVSILPSGMFIELTNGIEGFSALRNMSSYFYYFEETLNYINDFGLEYKLGDFVLVEYIGYNIERLEIDFKIIKKV